MFIVELNSDSETVYLIREGVAPMRIHAQRFNTVSQAWWSLCNRGHKLCRQGFLNFAIREV